MNCTMNSTDHDLLIKIDQQLATMQLQMSTFVTNDRFQPVETIAYGLVALIMIAVVGALISTVIRKKKE